MLDLFYYFKLPQPIYPAPQLPDHRTAVEEYIEKLEDVIPGIDYKLSEIPKWGKFVQIMDVSHLVLPPVPESAECKDKMKIAFLCAKIVKK